MADRIVTYSKDALRALSRCPVDVSKRIRTKVAQYARDPSSLKANVKALQGEAGIYRLRVGDWRVVFSENFEVVAVIKIASRGSVY